MNSKKILIVLIIIILSGCKLGENRQYNKLSDRYGICLSELSAINSEKKITGEDIDSIKIALSDKKYIVSVSHYLDYTIHDMATRHPLWKSSGSQGKISKIIEVYLDRPHIILLAKELGRKKVFVDIYPEKKDFWSESDLDVIASRVFFCRTGAG